MTDHEDLDPVSPENTERYSLNDIERTRAVLASDKVGSVMDASPLTTTEENVEEGIRYKTQWLNLVAAEEVSLLRNYGYSKVALWRSVSRPEYDTAPYTGTTTVDAYDLNGNETESYTIFQLSENRMGILTAVDKSNPHPTGFSDNKTQTAFLRFKDLDFENPKAVKAMRTHGWRALTGQEYSALLSLIMACEVEGM